jgi:hypothetical protein
MTRHLEASRRALFDEIERAALKKLPVQPYATPNGRNARSASIITSKLTSTTTRCRMPYCARRCGCESRHAPLRSCIAVSGSRLISECARRSPDPEQRVKRGFGTEFGTGRTLCAWCGWVDSNHRTPIHSQRQVIDFTTVRWKCRSKIQGSQSTMDARSLALNSRWLPAPAVQSLAPAFPKNPVDLP